MHALVVKRREVLSGTVCFRALMAPRLLSSLAGLVTTFACLGAWNWSPSFTLFGSQRKVSRSVFTRASGRSAGAEQADTADMDVQPRAWLGSLAAAAAVGAAAALVQKARPLVSNSGTGTGRREALLAASIGAGAAGSQPAFAYTSERTRDIQYNSTAQKVREMVDWYLFDVRPLVYPDPDLVARGNCEEQGEACPQLAALNSLYELYRPAQQLRSTANLSIPERVIFTPLKLLAVSNLWDPDSCDDLRTDSGRIEQTQIALGRAAMKGDPVQAQKMYIQGCMEFNAYFQKVNNLTGLPSDSEYYLTPLPLDQDVLTNDKYWARRAEKYFVKKKVDAVSKGSKTARFYAKSIFGDDAVSWDVRGDRAEDFTK